MYKMGNTEPISPTRLGEHCLVLRKTNSVWPLWLSYTMSVTLKNVLGTLSKTFSLPDLVIISQLSTLQTVSVFHKVICSHKTWASLWVPAEWRFYFSSRASIKSSHIKNWRRRRNERIAKKTAENRFNKQNKNPELATRFLVYLFAVTARQTLSNLIRMAMPSLA